MIDHKTPARFAEVILPLDAPVEDVWRALTDAAALVSWFPTDAVVDARPGGSFVISWEGQWQWDMSVTDCDPLRRLRLLDRAARPFDASGNPLPQAAPVELALEITLEPRGRASTVLRLVHSGFGHGSVWDDELDGVTLGWNVELRALRHYLAHHRGRSRHAAHAHATSSRPLAELWDALTGPSGLIASGYRPDCREGDPCTLQLTTGDTITGRVTFARPGRQLIVSASELGEGLFRLSLDRAAGESMVQVWAFTWSESGDRVRALVDRIRPVVDRAVACSSSPGFASP